MDPKTLKNITRGTLDTLVLRTQLVSGGDALGSASLAAPAGARASVPKHEQDPR